MTWASEIDELKRQFELPEGFSWFVDDAGGSGRSVEDGWRLIAEGSAHPDWNADRIVIYQSVQGDSKGMFVARLFVTPGPDSETTVEESSRSLDLDQLLAEIGNWTEPREATP